MALSDAQKQAEVFYLGWPGKSLIESSTHYNSVVVSRLKNLNSFIEQKVTSILLGLAALDVKLESASCRLSAKKVDGIELNPDEIRMLKSERRRFCIELSALLDLEYIARGGIMFGVTV